MRELVGELGLEHGKLAHRLGLQAAQDEIDRIEGRGRLLRKEPRHVGIVA
jgi:hypothetical protein